MNLEAGAGGITRSEISSDVFKRHRTRAELDRAFAVLTENGLARMTPEANEGRTAERWFAK